MGWRVIIVNTHSKLSYQNNHLIFKSSTKSEMIHLSEIDLLICETTDISITTMLLKKLADENILTIFCDEKRLPSSQMLPYYGRHDSSLQLTRQISWLEDKKSDVWTDIIAQKIINQANHLSQLTFDDTASAIHVLLDALEPFDPSNREGHSARIYFNKLFGNDFTRDANNDINAGLDYGYTLLMSVFAREIVKMGCMTQLGLKHSNQFNDFNLASDIMEPFRIIVDQIVYGHRNKKFGEIRRELFEMFATKYVYGRQEMFLTNIASDYTKRVIAMMNGESDKIPVFRI
ncbi:type II CRISPR-associated endonuclease Cas1 [Lactococcus raffinolactis]|jgi:CRISP-associated protein Cas1|uniref:CRISPR-associated endonuclease Cas1 n=1 Tax=Pseudolactococcus raffinolactis TaxID=1366 RepID=A0AAE6YLJ2_9LACT|nr:type II CRISPR-associated endonuclease Cas1 [Lactococcus raffinolactis]MBW9330261.1 type II CRISPR-associated endonuclease Cas1 [Lactococcus raffinolactis]QIW58647.1 type II CRISPR-associated endonuclease Cas1 [Lactococcus raffinolactis]QIW60835.1 type II CRISPR-associated endonuclease Cas1 [Lactococcus raffinolactis]